MSDFLNWELTNRMHNLGYDGKTLMYIDDEEDIINDDSAELIGAKPAILTSAAFRWFRENYNIHAEPYTADMGAIEYCFRIRDLYSEKYVYDNFVGGGSSYGGTFNTPEKAELECLKKLIEIVKEKK